MATKTVIATKNVFYPLARQGDGHFKTGAKFEMQEGDVSTHVALGLVAEAGGPAVAEKNEDEEVASDLETLRSLWDLQSTPAEYLKKFPEGPKSKLALNLLTAEAEAAEAAESEPDGPGASSATE